MKRSVLTRLQNSDVFSAPKSMGLKALRQNSIMLGDMELFGLHPLCLHYVQNTIGTEMIVFTEWVSTLGKINMELPLRSYWSDKTKDLERKLANDNIHYGRPVSS
jgi:hypothetical protein